MLDKNLLDITEQDLLYLKENAVEETTTLEFKQEIKLDTNDDKNELLKDIVAMANARGGIIIYGAKESDDHKLEDFLDLGISDYDILIRRITSLVIDRVRPRLISIDIQNKSVEEKNILLIKIKNSLYKPHSIVFNSYPRFPIRQNRQVNFMDVDELRNAFIDSNIFEKSIDSFVFERVNKLKENDGPVDIDSNCPFLALHIFPMDFLDYTKKYDLNELKQSNELNISNYIFNSFNNFDGVVGVVGSNSPIMQAYIQIFNNGIIEYIDQRFFNNSNNNIYIESLEKDLTKYIENNILKILNKMNNSYPYILKLGIYNISGYSIQTPNGYFYAEGPRRIKEEYLNFVLVKIEKEQDIIDFVLYVVRRISNACGISEYHRSK